MRIDADSDSKDYWALKIARPVEIALNGEVVKYCTLADEEAGYLECHTLDAKGNPMRASNGAEFIVERRHGEVKIIGERL